MKLIFLLNTIPVIQMSTGTIFFGEKNAAGAYADTSSPPEYRGGVHHFSRAAQSRGPRFFVVISIRLFAHLLLVLWRRAERWGGYLKKTSVLYGLETSSVRICGKETAATREKIVIERRLFELLLSDERGKTDKGKMLRKGA